MFQAPTLNLLLILPWLLIVGTAVVLMLLDLIVRSKNKTWIAWLSLVGIVLAFIQTIGLWGVQRGTFIPEGGTPMVMVDNYSLFINAIILLTAFMTVLISLDYLRKADLERGEYYYLMLFSVSGMMLMAMANDLILIFLALELLSIPLYVLSGFARPRLDSEESALKYFLLGAFASGFLVFGIAMVYGATGTTALPEVLDSAVAGSELLFVGAVLILVGLAFKVAAVPFHMWTPDVYEGAPTSVTAFMSVGAKVAGFAALIRIFIYALPDISEAWVPALAVIAALTMITGNVIALVQRNVKRMLAYSSIAHAGFIMMGVAAAVDSQEGMSAALFYMLAYLFTNLGAFAIVIAVERKDNQGVMLDDYKGLYKRSPLLALALAYFMLSLTGIPPTGGFTAKFGVFGAVINADMTWLAVIAVITSVVSAYFYLRVVFYSFMYDGEGEVVVKPAIAAAVVVALVLTFLLGVYPEPFFDAAREAVFSGTQVLAGG
ncbi:MAG TPA: NADH-quinone oxidoreductase subunit N [Anaerolineae bacterium]|jgi:NADH-quinone oxidoreductase subunit N|nr:NADH-quinone oxidoreductase subunit N [Anaerolineae bacterium]